MTAQQEATREAVAEGVEMALLRLGLDTVSVQEMRADFAYLRRSRLMVESMVRNVMRSAVALFITGVVSAIGLAIRSHLSVR